MPHPDESSVKQLVTRWTAGEREVLDQLMALLYPDLRRLAARHLRRERPNHTLQPTALANEAYLRLVDQRDISWQSRAHILGLAGQMMRRILVDHARRHKAAKRGGEVTPVHLDQVLDRPQERDVDLVALDDALRSLARLDDRQASVVELRFFGGLTFEETAHVLQISISTVRRDWRTAQAWLYRELSAGS